MKIFKSVSATRNYLVSPYPQDKNEYLFEWNDMIFINKKGKPGRSKEIKKDQILKVIKDNKLVAMSGDDMLDSPAKIKYMIETLDDARTLMSTDNKFVLALSVEWEEGQTLLVPAAWKKVNFEDHTL